MENHLNNFLRPTQVRDPCLVGVDPEKLIIFEQALELAISYLPHVKTDIPQFQQTLQKDLAFIEMALEQIRTVYAKENFY